MRPVRVLHVVANRWWTGTADPALGLATALREVGHVVRFACIPGDVLEERVRAAGFEPVAGLSLDRRAYPIRLLRDVYRLRQVLSREGVEIIHAHQSHDHWLAALAARGTPAALVRTVHHRRAVHRGPPARWLWRHTGAVIAVSEGIGAELSRAGVPRDRLRVIGGAVDVGQFRPEADGRAVRAELGLGVSAVIGCVARLVPGRGHEILLRAASLLRPRISSLRLVLVGRGEGRSEIEAAVRRLGLEPVVVFAGYRGNDLPAVLTALDAVVLLGAGSEESCRAVLEAMAAGRPVVAARVGAVPETVVDGETGWLVDSDPAAVAEGLRRLLEDPDRARAMGAAGRRRVEERFTPASRARAVEHVYARALGRSP
jgi:glycosyltransferase involved in cell wall biosynthesis